MFLPEPNVFPTLPASAAPFFSGDTDIFSWYALMFVQVLCVQKKKHVSQRPFTRVAPLIYLPISTLQVIDKLGGLRMALFRIAAHFV